MTDYQKYINALRKCANEHENDSTFTGNIIVSDLCRDTANLLEQLEQEPRKGHWIEVLGGCKCSRCDMAFSKLKETCADNYCPNCGADMRIQKRKGTPIEGNNESYNCENWIP